MALLTMLGAWILQKKERELSTRIHSQIPGRTIPAPSKSHVTNFLSWWYAPWNCKAELTLSPLSFFYQDSLSQPDNQEKTWEVTKCSLHSPRIQDLNLICFICISQRISRGKGVDYLLPHSTESCQCKIHFDKKISP